MGPTENSLAIVGSDGFFNEGRVTLFDPYSGEDREGLVAIEGSFDSDGMLLMDGVEIRGVGGTLDLATTVEVLPLQGELAPGLSVGNLTVEGDLPLDLGSQSTFILGGRAAGEFSRLVVTGDMVPNGKRG